MPKLSTYTLGSTTARQISRLATADTGLFNIMDPPFNASGDPAVDNTAALIAVRDAALATATTFGSKGVYVPHGATVRFTAPVDFRGISTVQCDGYLMFAGAFTDTCLKFGAPSADGATKYSFHGLYALSQSYATAKWPLAQFAGCRGSTVRIGTCNSFIEIVAEPGAYYSTAYSEFHMGSTWRLELRSPTLPANSSGGWINSNQFYGGSMAQLRIGGPWVDVTSIVGTTVTTTAAHNFSTGMLVEMYNGTPDDGVFRLITVTDATHFELSSGFATSGNPGNGWRCMGPSGYPHNDNTFLAPNIEDNPAIVHIQGQFNRILQARTEVGSTSPLVFAPHVFGNMYEASNTAQGYLPTPDQFPMVVQDFSGGKNHYGWVQPPKPWGGVFGVTSKTAAYTIISYADHQKTFDNTGATAIVPFVLPATVPVGFEVSFYVADTDGIRVTAGGSDTIRVLASNSVNGGKIESTTVGDAIRLRRVAGSTWAATDTNRAAGWTVT